MEHFFINEVLNSSSSSSSSTSSDDDGRERVPRIENYVEDIVERMSEEQFRQNFRMDRNVFDFVHGLLQRDLMRENIHIGRFPVRSQTQFLLALWFFGTPDSYRSVCSRFGVSTSTGHGIVRKVTNALIRLAPSMIQWPTDRGDQEEVMAGFLEMGFPNTMGAVDGSYIRIPKPRVHGNSYICRKNFPAINLTAVVDHRKLFTNVHIGEVGSTHDAEALRRSEIWAYLHSEERFPNDSHLVGDKAYPILPTLMTPFRDNGALTQNQRNYNYLHSRARSTVERAFGALKGRWRILLDCLPVISMEWAPKYILACCVLHNICIMRNDVMNVDIVEMDENNVIPEVLQNNELRRIAQQKRNVICNNIRQ